MSVRIAVMTPDQQIMTHLDNGLPDALHFYDDVLHTYLQGSAYTFEFCVPAQHPDAKYLQVGNRLTFRYEYRNYYLNIIKVEATSLEIRAEAQGLIFELLREEQPSLESSAKSFAAYFSALGSDTGNIRIGINEVAGKKLALKWEDSETILARLYSLANNFGAELEFVADLKADGTLDHLVINVFKKRPEGRGVGQSRTDVTLRAGIDYQTLRRTVDLSEVYTAIRPTGKDDLKLTGYTKPEDEFELAADMIRSPEGRDRFPSVVHGAQGDGYILYRWQTEYSTQAALYAGAAAELRKHCQPKISYEMVGYIPGAQIGDEYTIYDAGFFPELHAVARVVEQEICLSDQSKSKTIFDNFTEVK